MSPIQYALRWPSGLVDNEEWRLKTNWHSPGFATVVRSDSSAKRNRCEEGHMLGGLVMRAKTELFLCAVLFFGAVSCASVEAGGIHIGIGIPIGIGIGPAYPPPCYYRPYPYYYPPPYYYAPYPYAAPAPVYVQPAPVYAQPAPTTQQNYYQPSSTSPTRTVPTPPAPMPGPRAVAPATQTSPAPVGQ
jgi:hypothetical protein